MWKLGDIVVSQILEMPVEPGELDGLIEEATPDAVNAIDWLHPHYANDAGQTLWSLHAFVVETPEARVLVDAGCGNHKNLPLIPNWGGLDNPFLERLAEAGYRPEDIDVVLATHLHLDHVGWNTVLDDGAWRPTFPNARYTYVREEFEYHRGLAEGESTTSDLSHAVVYEGANPDIHVQTRLVFAESIQPCLDAGLVDLVDSDHEVTPGVRYASTPGHTKAHHSVRLESGGEVGVVTGDFIHHPIQLARPAWSSRGDWDRELSARSRTAFLESVVDTPTLVLGTHFSGPAGGHVVPDGEAFRFAPVQGS
ncbi:MBL fold metallo-hydrolase [Actinomycetospora termitidis]|uniref:MBL fold metallo-hydrolase n=1 Tax=Actinomycetospora termitidis TaxID=3053470 RepID=A0ABT7M6B1_9PSEU|nr:MBL fold metallo-hydrolase [Actinomycetospora sp. Odt1-22]MDL5156196.1 MBL fold metallo-hydrolase [Actinomycetospora sp. Odt1-22]